MLPNTLFGNVYRGEVLHNTVGSPPSESEKKHMRRSTPFRTMLLAFVASLVFVFGMVLSTGTVSAHSASTASAQSSASAMDASTGCGAFGNNQCNCGFSPDNCGFGGCQFGGCFNDCQFSGCFNSCEFGGCGFSCFGECGFNNCNSLEGFVGGDQFSSFENCSFFPQFRHHRHHRHHRDCDGDFDSDC